MIGVLCKYECHGVEVRAQSVESISSFHLYMGDKDQTRVVQKSTFTHCAEHSPGEEKKKQALLVRYDNVASLLCQTDRRESGVTAEF